MSTHRRDSGSNALSEQLVELVRREYGEYSTEEVRAAFAHALERLQKAPEPLERAKVSTFDEGEMTQPFDARHLTRSHGAGVLSVTANNVEETRRMLYQIVRLGVVLVRPGPLPSVNEFFDMRIQIPKLHMRLGSQGRVVHRTEAKAAVEICDLGAEDRTALRRALQDMRVDLDVEPVDVSSSEIPIARGTREGKPPASSPAASSESRSPRARKRPRGGNRGRNPLEGPLSRRRDRPRASVEMTSPDVEVLSQSERARREEPAEPQRDGELYGPGPRWLTPHGEPGRVEPLSEDRIVDILLQLSSHNFTGIATLVCDEVDRQLTFDGGLLVEIARRPRAGREELGALLLLADRVEQEQLAMAAAHADENDQPLARSLHELSILDADSLRHIIAGRLTFLLKDVVEKTDGELQIYDEETLPAGFLPQPPLRVHVAVERMIFKRQFEHLRQFNAAARDEHTASDLDTYPEIVSEETARLERAVTDPEHLQLIHNVITGRRRMREVFTESNLNAADTFAIIYSLHRMGLMRFDRSLHHTVVRERFRENVTVKYLSVHKASYFEVLNVHWSSYDGIVEKAYRDLVEQFSPDDVPDNMEEEVHQRVSEIRERVESAYQALSKREHRHNYRKRIMPEYKLAHAIPLFLKQAELAEKRQKWSDAADALRRIVEIAPDHEKARRRLAFIEDKIED